MLNWPITINQHMASAVTSALITVAFGAWKKFKVRDVAGIRMRRLVSNKGPRKRICRKICRRVVHQTGVRYGESLWDGL